jgi:L-threonylcarbamoyladenylate synthase
MNIDRIVSELKMGNLVITPTDTVYGIMADALNKDAIIKVFEAKNRDYTKPLILLVSSIDMLKEYTSELTNLELNFINKYCPGKVTMILKKNNKIDNLIAANSEYVGIRIPDNRDLIKIINELGNPVISTSANISNNETITSIDKIESSLLAKISYIEDGGYINHSASTIVKFDNDEIKILREGDLASIIKEDYNI